MEPRAIVFRGDFRGKIPGTNKWLGVARGRIYMRKVYRDALAAVALTFRTQRTRPLIDFPVDAELRISIWKMRDSDSPVKLLFDALEKGSVIRNDRQIRDFNVIRDYHHRDADDRLKVTLRVTGERVRQE